MEANSKWGVERENGARGLTATDVGGKLACVLIELHPRERRQTGRRWGGAEGGWWCVVVIINVYNRTHAHKESRWATWRWSEQDGLNN